MQKTSISHSKMILYLVICDLVIIWVIAFVLSSPKARIPLLPEIPSVKSEEQAPDPFSQRTIVDSWNFAEKYDFIPVDQRPNSVRVPILTYHHVAPLPSSKSSRPYFVSPEMFEKQMKHLDKKHYKSLTPAELYNLLLLGENPKQKSVMITFDDGNYDNFQYAYPILKKYDFTGVFYIVSDKIGIPISALQEMSQNGMVIESHSATHIDLIPVTDPATLSYEITTSKYKLQSVTGKGVTSFSYPGCGSNGSAVSTVATSGYLFAVSCGKSIDHSYYGRFSLSRMHVYSNFENFKKILSGIWEVTYDYE
ncbi:MAG: polysaccharide deacetylase family protein [Candidatus Dojkabacteria bacterium]|nr:polysaccharide deacetylase family protein [Candidatus Dojkabacteria bacterium]